MYLRGLAGTCATVPLVTTISNCNNAQSSVDQMNSVFTSLGSPAQYAAEVQAITSSLASAMPLLASIGVGIGMCSAAFNIGIEADTLTTKMLTDAGQTPITGPTCGDVAPIQLPSLPSFPTVAAAGAGLGALALAAVAIYAAVTKKGKLF